MTGTYVPGTGETDPKKINMSLQQVGPKIDTATANIATNTADIATNAGDITALKTPGYGLTYSGGLIVGLSKITASLGADVAISNSVYTDGPSIAQGTTGTWWVSGKITFTDSVANCHIRVKLWDGTNVIDSGSQFVNNANNFYTMSLSGEIAGPAANLRISATSTAAGATSTFKFNGSGNSKDSTISALRIA